MFSLFRLCRKDEISFDIVTETGNIVANNGNNVEATFDIVERIVKLVARSKPPTMSNATMSNVASTMLPFLATMSKQRSTLLPKTATMSNEFCVEISFFRQSRTLLRQCCPKRQHCRSFDNVASLGVNVASKMKWNTHIEAISRKVASRLHFLKQLKRAGAGLNDLLNFYCSVIRPVLEYASPVWHSSLTVAQTNALEYLQKRAMNIMFSGGIDYTTCLIIVGVDTLATRREYLTKRFFRRRVLTFISSCLHYLLLEKMVLLLRINYAVQRHSNHSL